MSSSSEAKDLVIGPCFWLLYFGFWFPLSSSSEAKDLEKLDTFSMILSPVEGESQREGEFTVHPEPVEGCFGYLEASVPRLMSSSSAAKDLGNQIRILEFYLTLAAATLSLNAAIKSTISTLATEGATIFCPLILASTTFFSPSWYSS